jgi:hypothetical protein
MAPSVAFSEARILARCAPQQQPPVHKAGKPSTKSWDSARTATGMLTQVVIVRCLTLLLFWAVSAFAAVQN